MAVLIQGDAWFAHAERPQPSRYRCLLSNFARLWWKVLLILLLLSLVSQVADAEPQPSESELKAAFIYNFAKFVEWPPNAFAGPVAPLQLCVLGNNPLRADLQNIVADNSIASRHLQVRRVEVLEIRGCHVLFVGTAENYRVQQALQAARGGSILTIGDTPGFLDQGGMINFVFDENRIRFEVNLKAAQGAQLRLSSKLLSLAKLVQM
jgi:YfiR/HmsC-like